MYFLYSLQMKYPASKIFASKLYLAHRLRLNQGEKSGGSRGAPPPPYFLTKLGPKGPKKVFWRLPPPPHPSPLEVWIRHWKAI